MARDIDLRVPGSSGLSTESPFPAGAEPLAAKNVVERRTTPAAVALSNLTADAGLAADPRLARTFLLTLAASVEDGHAPRKKAVTFRNALRTLFNGRVRKPDAFAQTAAITARAKEPARADVAAILVSSDREFAFQASTQATFDAVPAVPAAPGQTSATVLDEGLLIASVIGTRGANDPAADPALSVAAQFTVDPAAPLRTLQATTIDPKQNVLRATTVIRIRGTTRAPLNVRTTRTLSLTSETIFSITVNPMLSPAVPTPTIVPAPAMPAGVVIGSIPEEVATAPAVIVPQPAPVAPPPEPASLPWYQPEVYTVSVAAFVDDPSFQASTVSALSRPEPLRVVEMPADQLFTSMTRQRQQIPDEDAELALWILETPQEQTARVRATLDAEVFAAPDEPGSGAWGLSVLGGAASLRARPVEEEVIADERVQVVENDESDR